MSLETITSAVREVEGSIEAACRRANRSRQDVTLIAVSKTMPVSDIVCAMQAGLVDFGENKPQELRDKQAELKEPLRWHMIGSLQTNKLRYVVGKTVLIHSVDSIHLAEEINAFSERLSLVTEILLEINIASEATKHGFLASEVETAVRSIASLSHIKVGGLMTVAPYTDNPENNRKYFREMRQLMVDINCKNIDNIVMNKLSMGMTGDYEVAIEEGATHVRVGTGIFGHRVYQTIK